MKKIRVNDLSGIQLDHWVAKAEGDQTPNLTGRGINTGTLSVAQECQRDRPFHPSTDWTQGNLIIEREHIRVIEVPEGWTGEKFYQADISGRWSLQTGATYLEAAMRSYVMSRLGEVVEDNTDEGH